MTFLIDHPILILLGWCLVALALAGLWIVFAIALNPRRSRAEEEMQELEEAFQWPEKRSPTKGHTHLGHTRSRR